MATSTFSAFRSPIISSAAPQNRKPPPQPASKWWTPIFGWSSEPDYITNQTGSAGPVESSKPDNNKSSGFFKAGGFTEEKAKELRKKTIETSTFHDIMYHSAIASRLASDVSGRSPDL